MVTYSVNVASFTVFVRIYVGALFSRNKPTTDSRLSNTVRKVVEDHHDI